MEKSRIKKEIANSFNNYFSSIGCEITNCIPLVNKSPFDNLNRTYEPSLFLNPVSIQEVELEILNLKLSKSTGPYGIPTMLLTPLYNLLSKPLADIYNCSFQREIT